jgi:hypothetical protein
MQGIKTYYFLYGVYPEPDNLSRCVIVVREGAARKHGSLPVREGMHVTMNSAGPRRFLFWYLQSPLLDSQGRYLDGWGRPIYVTIRPESHLIMLRSWGGNGMDDECKGDDRCIREQYP